jgi:hypothetical protein
MPPELLHDEAYASEEDSDFAPEDALAEESSESDEEEATDAERSGPGKRKRPSGEDGADDDGFQNSGDEAIIEKGRKRQQKSRRKDSASDGDEPGEGGLIKTRRMRAAEYVAAGSLLKEGERMAVTNHTCPSPQEGRKTNSSRQRPGHH